jgi:hypothetical protein
MVSDRMIGAVAYWRAITEAIPSLAFEPESSTMTMTLLAVGVKNTIIL